MSVDLRQLAVERAPAGQTSIARRRSWLARWGVPLAIILGFVAVVGWSAREHWLPSQPVTVVPVVMTKAEIQQAGTPLFQSAGWVEPRPTAVMCTALTEGIVEELLVVEGQAVAVDEPVAKLLATDVKLSLRDAESTLKLRESERDAAQAVLIAAKQNVAQPVQLEAAYADAQASLATLETEINNLPFQIKSAEARLLLAGQDLTGKKSVADSIAGRLIQRSQSEYDTAAATLAELQQREPNLVKQQEAWQRKCEALHTKLKLKIDELRALDEAKANLAGAEARVAQASVAVDVVKLRLQRLVVCSPIKGRVLALNAQPGSRLMGMTSASSQAASTVVTLYDPQKLQIRADVRLEDVGQVQLGQPVQISTAALKEPIAGHVLTMTSQADIQKNTLQVKVAIDDPPSVIRPEMLAQVVFLAPENQHAKTASEQQLLRLLIPKELVLNESGSVSIWVANSLHGTARKQAIQLGRAGTEVLVEVTTGLTALDKLIVSGRDGLTDGQRIRITGSDQSLGNGNARTMTSKPLGDGSNLTQQN